jgi:AFG3 family protein
LLREKRHQVETLAKELLDKEVLHKSDVENLIGKRPFEEKKILEIEPEQVNGHTQKESPTNNTENAEATV